MEYCPAMEFALYVSKLHLLEDPDETLRQVDVAGMPPFVNQLLFLRNPNAMEYTTHVTSLRQLTETFGEPFELQRCYFGQEFCQELMPDTETIRGAYYLCRQFGWSFTYMTPGVVTDDGMRELREHFSFLASEAPGCEVVVNNWALLHVLPNEYPGLTPVLGRMLVKQARLARYTSERPPWNPREIDADPETITANQVDFMRSVNLSLESYRRDLAQRGVGRADVDIVPQGLDVPSDKWGFGLSCHYPWTYVTHSRNCLTASVHQARREHVVGETACPRPCQKENTTTVLKDPELPLFERGNTVFLLNQPFSPPYFSGDIPIDRLVYCPYLPI